MKVEIKKEFSASFMADRYWVYFNDTFSASFATLEEAHERIKLIKHACTKPEPEVVYSEEF